MNNSSEVCVSQDILRGASQIAYFLFGKSGSRRAIYHLIETGSLPHFRVGALICARRSTLLSWIEGQERSGLPIASAPLWAEGNLEAR